MLNDIELKLLTFALDHAAYPGESDNAAIMFIRKLRERNATAEELTGRHEPAKIDVQLPPWYYYEMPFGKYEGQRLMDIPESYLEWVLYNCRNIKPKLRNAIINVINEE